MKFKYTDDETLSSSLKFIIPSVVDSTVVTLSVVLIFVVLVSVVSVTSVVDSSTAQKYMIQIPKVLPTQNKLNFDIENYHLNAQTMKRYLLSN